MLVKEFDYYLPAELIARYPAAERDASRLMVLNRQETSISETVFGSLTEYLKAGDLLVMNDTRVIPARLFGRKSTGGRVEIFLVRRDEGPADRWTCLLKSSKGLREGQLISLDGGMTARVCNRLESGAIRIEFFGDIPFDVWLEQEGSMPLPPYLQRNADGMDRERYQTVYASKPGAVAAPTAGLHFTQGLLEAIQAKGVGVARITLHTGLGTFQPVRVEKVVDHRIHTEYYSIPESTAETIATTKANGGRVIAVGTTTARTLEYAADLNGLVKAGEGEADIFIYPGYSFKVVDALITNFHLPESTLIMLVSAFAGKEFVFEAYRQAVSKGYRFYSYGDAMLII
jgi:S-adenosylmethionine:tRNA ribosyltransferase-isomerase